MAYGYLATHAVGLALSLLRSDEVLMGGMRGMMKRLAMQSSSAHRACSVQKPQGLPPIDFYASLFQRDNLLIKKAIYFVDLNRLEALP